MSDKPDATNSPAPSADASTSADATTKDEPKPAPTDLESDAENLVVYVFPDPQNPTSPQGALYSLRPEVYSDPKHRISGPRAAVPANLLSQGVVVAKIPNPAIGSGGFCYLLNLPALAPPDVNPIPLVTPKTDS